MRPLEPASASHALVFAILILATNEFAIFEQSRLVSEFGRFGISRASFCGGMEILRSLSIFMDLHSVPTNGDIRRMGINPSSAIEIVDPVRFIVFVHGGMGMAAENARRLMVTGIGQGARGDLRLDKVFLSVTGLDAHRGASTLETEEALVFRKMLKQSKQVIVVADPSKLGQVSPAFICPANEIHLLITSTAATDESIAPFDRLGVRILRV